MHPCTHAHTHILYYIYLLPQSLLCLSTNTVTTQRIENDNQVVIAFIVEDNSACILPYFLGTLDRLTYPKEKITLW